MTSPIKFTLRKIYTSSEDSDSPGKLTKRSSDHDTESEHSSYELAEDTTADKHMQECMVVAI